MLYIEVVKKALGIKMEEGMLHSKDCGISTLKREQLEDLQAVNLEIAGAVGMKKPQVTLITLLK